MSSDELFTQVRHRMASLGDRRFQASIQRFFKEPIRSYGIPSAQIRRIAAELYREVKPWPLAQRNRFCNRLWESGMNEEGALAIFLYQRFARTCGACEFKLFERWIDRFVTNWGHCDGVSIYLLGAAILNEPSLSQELPAWAASANRWKRRAAAVSLVPAARRGLLTEAIFDIATRLAGDTDDLVQKATGWLLKETYPKQPIPTVRFLKTTSFPRIVLRYAAGKMPAKDRRAVLPPLTASASRPAPSA